jgi:hypothetical protein
MTSAGHSGASNTAAALESTEGTNLTEWAQSVLLIESRSKRQSQRAAMTSLRTLAAARILRENGGKR